MKQFHFIAAILLTTILLCSCDSGDKVEKFVKLYATAVANGDKNTIESLYPGSTTADSLVGTFPLESIEVTDQDSIYFVKLSDGIDMKIKKNGDNLMIVESHGLFAYPEHLLSFAKKTGQWKDGLNDLEQAKRMADHGLEEYLYETFNQKIKDGLRIKETGSYGDDYYEGEWVSADGATFIIQNDSPYDIPGEAYSIIYKSGYWGGGQMSSETVVGKDVNAGESVELRTTQLGPNMESETTQKLVVNKLTKEDFLAKFRPKGNEYEEYLSRDEHHPATKAETLSFILEGQMGGCGTRIGMDGKSGNLMYSRNSGNLEIGEVEQRYLSLISYDPATSQLVLKVEKIGGTVTGKLIGTYKDGQYYGKFHNVNGKSSSFSFK